jgi:RimJ/RimL family protein N-acetyltransferase
MRVFRKLLSYEIGRLREHLLRLSPADRRLRFFAGIGEEPIADHCRRIDFMRAVIIGFFEGGVLRGAAELYFGGPAGACAELAFTLEAAWQDQHIGTDLLNLAIMVAENRGVRTVEMICLLENHRVQHIVHKFNGRLDMVDDQAEANLTAPFPTQLSLWEEAAMEGMGLITGWLEAFLRPVIAAAAPQAA